MTRNKLEDILTLLKARFVEPKVGLTVKSRDRLARERGIKKFQGLADCVNRNAWNTSFFYTRSRELETYTQRCQLRQRCPRCMGADNIQKLREKDYQALLESARLVGGGEQGQDVAVWLVEQVTEAPAYPPTARKLAGALTRKDRRYRPILDGSWAGEAATCTVMESITEDANGLHERTAIVFIVLLVASPCAMLDEARLRKFLPGCRIEAFHGELPKAWEAYLSLWANRQIESRTPEQVVEWMISDPGRRNFQTIGLLRGLKTDARKQYYRNLHQTKGRAVMVSRHSSQEKSVAVLARARHGLNEKYRARTGENLDPTERAKILAMLKANLERKGALGEKIMNDSKLNRLERHMLDLKARLAEVSAQIEREADQPETLEQERRYREAQVIRVQRPKRIQ